MSRAALVFLWTLLLSGQDATELVKQANEAITAKEYDKAGQLAERALQADGRSSEAWRARGRVRIAKQDYQGAAADFTKSIECDARNYRALGNRAYSLLYLKRPADAQADAKRALELNPQYGYAAAILGDALFDQKRWKEALDAYSEALRLDPKRAAAMGSRGLCRLRMDDPRGAAEDLTESIRMDASIPHNYYNRGMARMRLQDYAGAKEDFGKSLELGHQVDNARQQLAKADELLKSGELAAQQKKGAGAVKVAVDAVGKPAAVTAAGGPMAIAVTDVSPQVKSLPVAEVSYTIEGLRMMAGVGNKEKAWGTKWQEYFDYPSKEVVDYFQKLNPMVEELQAVRSATAEATLDYRAAMADAVLSKAAGDAEGVVVALAQAERHGQAVMSATARMKELQKKAEALGNPPDAKAAKARAKAWMKGTAGPGLVSKYAYQWRLSQVQAINTDIRMGNSFGSMANPGKFTPQPELPFPGAEAAWCKWFEGGKQGQQPLGAEPPAEKMKQVNQWVNSVYDIAGVEPGLQVYFFQHVPAEEAAQEILAKGKIRARAIAGYVPPKGAPPVKAEAPKAPVTPVEPPKDAKALAEEAKWKAEAISEKEDLIKMIQRNLAKDEAEWQREKDPRRKEELYLRVLNNRSAVQQERDLVQSLKTGEYVHTRTASDEYCHDLMIVRTVEHNQAVAETRRLAAAVEKMAAGAEPDQVKQLQAFTARQISAKDIAEGNVAKARQAAQAVFDTVQGRREQRLAASMEEEIRNSDYLLRAERVKMIAGLTLMVTGIAAPIYAGSAAAAAGVGAEAAAATATAVGQSVTLVNVVYGGTTGGIEGGPVELFKGAVGMSGMPGMVVSEMMTGYQRGGLVSEGGVMGALERGTEAFLAAKGIEKIAGSLAQWWTGADDAAAAAAGAAGGGKAPPVPKMTVGEMMERAEFQLAKNLAQKKIDKLQQTAARIRDLRAKGAPAEELAALQAQAMQQTTAISEDLLAKRMIKNMGKQARAGKGEPALGQLEEDYAAAVDIIHKTQVDPAFRKAVNGAGYRWRKKRIGGGNSWEDGGELKFKDIRHAGAEKTANTDRDKALEEMANEEGVIYQLFKGDKPVNLSDAERDLQQIYNRAYSGATGGNAQMAQHSITTSRNREAYKDLTYTKLSEPGNVERINKGWAGQSVEVLKAKVEHGGPGQGDFANLFRKIDGANQAAKDIDKRLMPILKAQQAKATGPRAAEIGQDMEKWKAIQGALERMETDPVRASRELRVLTGMDSVGEVTDAIGKRFLGAAVVQ
ncbi:MAG: tetratricopeptide repeat protein [Acidobacteria bacterium]|nr:tetratricopeptide repeat protein [Acidobacteriota bacterium]